MDGPVGEFITNFVKAFVPLFFAVDALGILPLFLGLTAGIDRAARQAIVKQSLATAMAVAVGFVLLGKGIFALMGILVGDFLVAGGALLFALAAIDIVSSDKPARHIADSIGPVPLGVPIIIGPATLTMSLILVDLVGVWPTLAAIVVNVALAGAVLLSADVLMRILGRSGSRVVSKVANLILAAIAVMMIRKGLTELVALVKP